MNIVSLILEINATPKSKIFCMDASDALEALLDALGIEDTDHVEIIAEQDDDGWYIEVGHEEAASLH